MEPQRLECRHVGFGVFMLPLGAITDDGVLCGVEIEGVTELLLREVVVSEPEPAVPAHARYNALLGEVSARPGITVIVSPIRVTAAESVAVWTAPVSRLVNVDEAEPVNEAPRVFVRIGHPLANPPPELTELDPLLIAFLRLRGASLRTIATMHGFPDDYDLVRLVCTVLRIRPDQLDSPGSRRRFEEIAGLRFDQAGNRQQSPGEVLREALAGVVALPADKRLDLMARCGAMFGQVMRDHTFADLREVLELPHFESDAELEDAAARFGERLAAAVLRNVEAAR
jgi:hypothetical protein